MPGILSIFQSHLHYRIRLQGNISNVDKIISLQKKAVRKLGGASLHKNCKPPFKKFRLLTFSSV